MMISANWNFYIEFIIFFTFSYRVLSLLQLYCSTRILFSFFFSSIVLMFGGWGELNVPVFCQTEAMVKQRIKEKVVWISVLLSSFVYNFYIKIFVNEIYITESKDFSSLLRWNICWIKCSNCTLYKKINVKIDSCFC